jgi:hypothetical protein
MNTPNESKLITNCNQQEQDVQSSIVSAEDIKQDQSQHPLAQRSQPYDWSSILQITS